LCGVVGGISARLPEIRIIRWKFKKSAEFSDFPQIFYFSNRRFGFVAGKFFSRRFSNFPAEFLNFRRNISRSAGNLENLLEILFSSGCFKFPADFLFFQRMFSFSSWKKFFPADVLFFRQIF
jgi:hypothetical protein